MYLLQYQSFNFINNIILSPSYTDNEKRQLQQETLENLEVLFIVTNYDVKFV